MINEKWAPQRGNSALERKSKAKVSREADFSLKGCSDVSMLEETKLIMPYGRYESGTAEDVPVVNLYLY